MELRDFINHYIKVSKKKYRFIIHTQECDFINTGANEISFYELFQIVGITLLDCEVIDVLCKENICKIEVE